MSWRFEVYETLGSTSDFCRERAEQGALSGLAVLARYQSAGRGTRGRDWVDLGGNLSFSFLLRLSSAHEMVGVLPFMTALAVFEGVVSFVGDCAHRFSLKWPNDLLLDDRKIAGILIEWGGSAGDYWIVIGVGANLSVAPEMPDRQLAALSEIVAPPDPLAVAQTIMQSFDNWLACWHECGFSPIREAWLSHAHPVGRQLAVRTRETYITGMFSGLDEQGRLLLELQDGRILPVVTGDILLS